MAQGAVAAALPTNGASLTAQELLEIAEYEKICLFRDQVLAGTHPRVKIPLHLVKQPNAIRKTASPSVPPNVANGTQPAQTPSGGQNTSILPSNNAHSPNYSRVTSGQTGVASSTEINPILLEKSDDLLKAELQLQRQKLERGMQAQAPIASKSEINPILLEKSDDLLRAEMQLQRQRLERGLREHIEQERVAAKALLQTSESLPNFDLTEVLSKALAIVHPSTATEIEPPVNADADASASDSFDENTFYSSQHDTPSPRSASNEPVAQSNPVTSAAGKSEVNFAKKDHSPTKDSVITSALSLNDSQLTARTQSQQEQKRNSSQQQAQFVGSRSASLREFSQELSDGRPQRENEPATVSKTQQHNLERAVDTTRQPINQIITQVVRPRSAYAKSHTPPLVRSHNLSPKAPQPARVSPLATAREPRILQEPFLATGITPPQVSNLRHEPHDTLRAQSSPRALTGSEKKRGRKERRKDEKERKRKSSAGAIDTLETPYIKPEPRSPSPFAMAPLSRPQKRQRQMVQELNYDEPTRRDPVPEVMLQNQQHLQERGPERYSDLPPVRIRDRYEDRYESELRRPEPVYQRVERDDGDYRRVQYLRAPESPTLATLPYVSDPRIVRAPSRAVVDRRLYDEPTYYREPMRRASVRPDADRERSRSPILRERRSPLAMAPPRRPVRIIVDEYGREYFDPGPIEALPMAPPNRYREEVMYERRPLRAVSSRVLAEPYDDEGIIYRRPSPVLTAPRRVAVQPEYAIPEHRAYRQREYSVRPSAMPPPGDDHREVREVSHLGEPSRQYLARAPSVIPEPVRYELPREYVTRQLSVRPDAASESVRYEAPRDYRPQSMRPEIGQGNVRYEYVGRQSVRPEAMVVHQREYSTRSIDPNAQYVAAPAGERFYDEHRRHAEITYDRPRGGEVSVMVYGDEPGREVYR